MNNETFEARLLKEHTPDPLEGHSVVVFERAGEKGERFHSVLEPGGRLVKGGLRGLLNRRTDYFAFAVDASPELFLDFSHHVVMLDHAHELDLLFKLYYSVDDPKLLATRRAKDPLKLVREKIAHVIAGEIAQFEWDYIWYQFRSRADTVVQDHLRALRTSAAQYGIAIRSIQVDPQLPDETTSAIRGAEQGKQDAQFQTELELAQLRKREIIARERKDVDFRLHQHVISNTLLGADLEDEGLALQRRRKQQDAANEAAVAGWTNIGKGIDSVDEMRALQEGLRRSTREPGDGGEYPGRIGAGENGTSPAHALRAGGLARVVSDLTEATVDVTPGSTRSALRGAVLHLVAEVVSDAAGDPNRTEEYARLARKLVERLDPRPGSAVLETLHALIDPATVNRMVQS